MRGEIVGEGKEGGGREGEGKTQSHSSKCSFLENRKVMHDEQIKGHILLQLTN